MKKSKIISDKEFRDRTDEIKKGIEENPDINVRKIAQKIADRVADKIFKKLDKKCKRKKCCRKKKRE